MSCFKHLHSHFCIKGFLTFFVPDKGLFNLILTKVHDKNYIFLGGGGLFVFPNSFARKKKSGKKGGSPIWEKSSKKV